MWDLIVSVPDHCLSFYFVDQSNIDPVMVLLIPINLGQRGSPQAAVKRSMKRLATH